MTHRRPSILAIVVALFGLGCSLGVILNGDVWALWGVAGALANGAVLGWLALRS